MNIENLNQASFKEYLDSCGVNENTMIFALNCFEYGRQSVFKDDVIEIEFLDWVHPRFGVLQANVEGGKPLILRAKLKEKT